MKYKIKVKAYIFNPALSWEDRYKELEKHHLEETNELIETIKDLENEIDLEHKLRAELYNDWSALADRALSTCKIYEQKIRKMEKR